MCVLLIFMAKIIHKTLELHPALKGWFLLVDVIQYWHYGHCVFLYVSYMWSVVLLHCDRMSENYVEIFPGTHFNLSGRVEAY